VRFLDKNDANLFLGKIGFTIGEWNRIRHLNQLIERHQVVYRPTKEALLMYCFSQHIAGWLPRGNWQIFQIDDVTSLEGDEAMFVSRLIGAEKLINLNEYRTLLFECSADQHRSNLMTISYLIYAFLLFEAHGYLVSSGCKDGKMICIQDGSVSFDSEEKEVPDAQVLVSLFENNPRKSPEWLFGPTSANSPYRLG
jgi:hypothetical protein